MLGGARNIQLTLKVVCFISIKTFKIVWGDYYRAQALYMLALVHSLYFGNVRKQS